MVKHSAWHFLGKRQSRGSGSFENMERDAITPSLLQYGFTEDTGCFNIALVSTADSEILKKMKDQAQKQAS